MSRRRPLTVKKGTFFIQITGAKDVPLLSFVVKNSTLDDAKAQSRNFWAILDKPKLITIRNESDQVFIKKV
jgi:hypothetical protein